MPKWSVYGPFILRDPIAEAYSHYFVELNLEQDSWIPGGIGLENQSIWERAYCLAQGSWDKFDLVINLEH